MDTCRARDLASFGPAADRTRVAEVALRKGWGKRVQVVGEVPGELRPIGGASIQLDGVFIGTTDARGILDVERESVPDRIEVHKRGWTLRGDIDLKHERARHSHKLEIRMTPVR